MGDLYEDLIPESCRNATIWPEEIAYAFNSTPLAIVNNGQRMVSENMSSFRKFGNSILKKTN